MQLIDTHTHLFLPEFDNDREAVLENALEQGITKMFLPNVDLDTIEPMLDLHSQYPGNCFPLIALHPEGVDTDFEKKLQVIEQELETGKYYGIGETGIDLYWDKTFFNEQVVSFESHIKWAIKYRLPLIIHHRNSFDEILASLKKYASPELSGIFHCFTGNLDKAKQIIDMGFYPGIGGIVTFKNAGLDKTVADIPLEKIVLETDSPYLSPIPKRGKRNESAHLVYIAGRIADIKGITVEEVAEVTTANAGKIFEKKE